MGLAEREWQELEDPPGHVFTVIRGELDVTPGATPEHGRALGELYVGLRRELPAGLRIVIDVDWHLTTEAVVTAAPRPDLMVIPAEGPVVPILVTEVLSPSDHHRFKGTDWTRIHCKRLDYAAAGLAHYLEVDLAARTVTRFELLDGVFVLADQAAGDRTLRSDVPFSYQVTPTAL